MKNILFIILAFLIISCSPTSPNEFVLADNSSIVNIYIDSQSDDLIKWAANDFAADLKEMAGKEISVGLVDQFPAEGNGIVIGKFNNPFIQSTSQNFKDRLANQWEKYVIEKQGENLVVAGSDIRGTVYGIFELAERIGISPWKWWADVAPMKMEEIRLAIPPGGIESSPSVKFRGIFLNDEDWGLQPWAAHTFEPEVKDIGPKTYEKIFQLLLRLKANTIWPAMHPSTQAFFSITGNKEMAEKYHIFVGTSHAEPMLRNNVDEWDEEEFGQYNYFENSEKVKSYWQERIDEATTGDYLFTMGMRGIHDSGMEGDASEEEKVQLLENIISDQRQMLQNTLNKPIETIPQVFIPYKEVLYHYNSGLNVPEDITLMWSDDNYGYIRRLSNETEQQRKGGGGVYYHLSYWGRPHDYLWLSTTQPGLIWYEMSRAYQNGAQQIWIANVGDIKPAEYTMEFFLDLAWNVNSIRENTIKDHLVDWSEREFGSEKTAEIADLMVEYYRLAMLCKPEYMGWSQTEPTTETKPTGFTLSNNNELQRRIDAYSQLFNKAEELRTSIPEERQDAYFQLIEYPVKGAALMNFKFLYARQSMLSNSESEKEEYARKAQQAYDKIAELTAYYNKEMSNGKWNKMMDMAPRELPVFSLPDFHLTKALGENQPATAESEIAPIAIQANEFNIAEGSEPYQWEVIEGLGYSNASVTLSPFDNHLFEGKKPFLEYEFQVEKPGDYEVEVRCLPTHANDFDFKIGIAANDKQPNEYAINTKGRSEAWKENVLRNAVVTSHPVSFAQSGKQTLRIYVNRTGIVLDQIGIHPEGYGEYYEIRN